MTVPTVVAFDLSLTSTGVADRNGTREHCWHIFEVLPAIPPQVRQRCCWCDSKRVVVHVAPAMPEHGPHTGEVAE